MILTIDGVSRRLRQGYVDTEFNQTLSRLPKLSSAGPWVAGGSVRRLFEEKVNDSDFDFFFANAEQMNVFKSALEAGGALLQNTNDKNSTWILPRDKAGPEVKIQIITFQYYSSMQNIVDSFDFTLCQFAFDGSVFEVGDMSLYDVARKQIVPSKLTYAVASVRRLLKYTRQGYTICSGGLAEMLRQVVENPAIIQADIEYID
jgi:hypothetical protein